MPIIRAAIHFLLCSLLRQRDGVCPIFIRLANHSSETARRPAAKALVLLLSVPPAAKGDGKKQSAMSRRNVIQAVLEHILDLLKLWEDGFFIVLPGDTTPSFVVLKIGAVLADMMEMIDVVNVPVNACLHCQTLTSGLPHAGVCLHSVMLSVFATMRPQ